MKPIEPGCLAIVTTGPNYGEECHVVSWVDHGGFFLVGSDVWENNTGVNAWAVEFSDGCGVYLSRHLLRIDYYQSETTETEQEVTA